MEDGIRICGERFSIESKIIDRMRFPLAAMVVFVHVPRVEENMPPFFYIS